MSDPNIDQGTFWGVVATAVVAIGAALGRAKGWWRGERIADAAADVEVTKHNATTGVIKMLEDQLHALRTEFDAFRVAMGRKFDELTAMHERCEQEKRVLLLKLDKYEREGR